LFAGVIWHVGGGNGINRHAE
jgi:hypothetical protein